jgi:hypothetical protein
VSIASARSTTTTAVEPSARRVADPSSIYDPPEDATGGATVGCGATGAG